MRLGAIWLRQAPSQMHIRIGWMFSSNAAALVCAWLTLRDCISTIIEWPSPIIRHCSNVCGSQNRVEVNLLFLELFAA